MDICDCLFSLVGFFFYSSLAQMHSAAYLLRQNEAYMCKKPICRKKKRQRKEKKRKERACRASVWVSLVCSIMRKERAVWERQQQRTVWMWLMRSLQARLGHWNSLRRQQRQTTKKKNPEVGERPRGMWWKRKRKWEGTVGWLTRLRLTHCCEKKEGKRHGDEQREETEWIRDTKGGGQI